VRTLSRIVAPVGALALVCGLSLAAAPAVAAPAQTGESETYVVLYKATGVGAKSLAKLSAAGGTVVQTYPQIGVAIVSSDRVGFGDAVEAADPSVQGAASTAALGVQLADEATDAAEPIDPGTPAPGDDPLSSIQWDMDQISAPEARAINGGSASVIVGDIDSGLDWTHPDLAPNVDFSRSVSCVGGVPNQDRAAWMDDDGHGTHTAGTIAAAKNGLGMVGVAPNVKIAGIKAGDADGFFYPEAVVCSFMWAATHGIQVTNNSYFADPWLFNCKNDPEQRAIWEAERRAIRFAQQSGTVVVSALGNQSDDLAHTTGDATSPDTPTPVQREISNACAIVPAEVPGVIGVTANGIDQFKSYYSSYGMGAADVVAPGGDRRFQVTQPGGGRILSTWPASLLATTCGIPLVSPDGAYCYIQGTSMASPHVAGVAALIVSTGITNPGTVAARITGTADPIACPTDMSVYANFPAVDNGAPQVCTGGIGYNSFNGHGQVNALSAIGG
jgi:subtilisin family serine protease